MGAAPPAGQPGLIVIGRHTGHGKMIERIPRGGTAGVRRGIQAENLREDFLRTRTETNLASQVRITS